MLRREFVVGLGAGASWPAAASGQPSEMRRIGILFVYGETHPEVASFVAAIKERLQ